MNEEVIGGENNEMNRTRPLKIKKQNSEFFKSLISTSIPLFSLHGFSS